MKVKKAIKRIAALGVGATMMGATLMGAMAADLSEYPDMFITDGQFDGLLVVGERADAVDTIGVTNIALGLQKAAVTKTMVCGTATASRTTVTGEKVQIEKTGDALNIGDELGDVQTTAVDDGDLPSILADGEYNENEGNTKNDVTYRQEITLGTGTGTVVYDQDDDDAPDAGVYVKFPKGVDIYTYTLEFDDAVDYDVEDAAEDLEMTNIEIQGQLYTITEAEFNDDDEIEKLTLMVGDTVMWISQDETVTKEINGVDHTITMVDVSNNEDKCGFLVDGTSIWIDTGDTKTISGVTLGVTEATAVHHVDYDADICKVYIGAEELVLEDGQEVEVGGDEVDGSLVTITSDGDDGEWTLLEITFDPSDDAYLAEGDEWIDPVFGNFKFIMGGEVAVNEEISLVASSNKATLTFTNYDDEEIEIPFIMDDAGDFFLGEDEDLGANADEGFYLEGDVCEPDGGDVTDCAGAKFLVVVDNVAHVVELASIDDPDATDPEIDFDDITYGTSTDNKDYENGENEFSLGSGVGTITLDIDTAAGTVTFTELGDGSDMYTQYKGIIALDEINRDGFTFTENDEDDVEDTFTIDMEGDDDDEAIEISTPAGFDNAEVDLSDSDDDNQMYYSIYGSIAQYDSDDKDDFTLWHPEEQLYVDFFIAEESASTMSQEGSGEGCSVSEKINPIPSTVNKFDTEVSNPGAQNLVSVGGPCANSVSSSLLGNPTTCYEGFETGKALLKLVESGSNVALIVAGGSGDDTRLASKILQDYEDFDLSGMEMEAITVSESGLSVGPVSAPATVAEEAIEAIEDAVDDLEDVAEDLEE